ncbi:MAG: NAD(P)/FAD-dependent oxidoreductase [Acidobacteriaceae bacterium]
MTDSSNPNPAENLYDVAVVGAGIIGLSAALALRDAGMRVVVLDQQEAMHEASWAAAGMLAANDPHNPAEMHALAVYSEGLYPEFLARVKDLTGREIPIRSRQTLEGLPAGEDAPGRRVTAEEIAALAPGLELAPGLKTGELVFFLMEESSLDPCDLTEILPGAIRAAGIELREYTQVLRVEADGGLHRLTAAQRAEEKTEEAQFTARHVVFATGAWRAPVEHAPAVEPRKGQLVMLNLRGPEQTACTLRVPGLYVVPRGNGNYVVGATIEDTGFDQSTSEPMIADMVRRAVALWPPLARASRGPAWAGLRPMSVDGLPVIGPLTPDEAQPTLWVAMGHFRNGILLAPGTAHVLRDLILGRAPEVSVEGFRLGRFAGAVE